jgi:hypothetical protein
MLADGRTDMTKLIGAFQTYGNSRKEGKKRTKERGQECWEQKKNKNNKKRK